MNTVSAVNLSYLEKHQDGGYTKDEGTETVQITFTCNEGDIGWSNGKVNSIVFKCNDK